MQGYSGYVQTYPSQGYYSTYPSYPSYQGHSYQQPVQVYPQYSGQPIYPGQYSGGQVVVAQPSYSAQPTYSQRPVAPVTSGPPTGPFVGDPFCSSLGEVKYDELRVRWDSQPKSQRGEMRVVREDKAGKMHDCPATREVAEKWIKHWSGPERRKKAKTYPEILALAAFYGLNISDTEDDPFAEANRAHPCAALDKASFNAANFQVMLDGELRYKPSGEDTDCPVPQALAKKWIDAKKPSASAGTTEWDRLQAAMVYYNLPDPTLAKTVSGDAQKVAAAWKAAGGTLDPSGNPILLIGVAHPRPLVEGQVYNIDGRLWRARADNQFDPAN